MSMLTLRAPAQLGGAKSTGERSVDTPTDANASFSALLSLGEEASGAGGAVSVDEPDKTAAISLTDPDSEDAHAQTPVENAPNAGHKDTTGTGLPVIALLPSGPAHMATGAAPAKTLPSTAAGAPTPSPLTPGTSAPADSAPATLLPRTSLPADHLLEHSGRATQAADVARPATPSPDSGQRTTLETGASLQDTLVRRSSALRQEHGAMPAAAPTSATQKTIGPDKIPDLRNTTAAAQTPPPVTPDSVLNRVQLSRAMTDGRRGSQAPSSEPIVSLAGLAGSELSQRAGAEAMASSSNQPPGLTSQTAPAAAPASATQPPAGQSPVGSRAWAEAMSQHSVRMASQGVTQAQVHVHPRDLGPISIQVHMDDQQAVQVHFGANHAQARDALDQAMPQLRQAFADSGLSLGQASVGNGDASSGQFSRQRGTAGVRPGDETEADDVPVDDVAKAPRSRHDGVLDLFA